MKIMVFNVPAESGGALTILENFYDEVKHSKEDVEWIFVLSTPEFKETKNIKVLNYKWIKKNWVFRLFFDYFVAPKIVKENSPDKIFSLQNVSIPRTNIKQTIYVHQPLPFTKVKFKFNKNPKLWIYQNVIAKSIYRSIKKADKVIVQMNWFAEECEKKVKGSIKKIKVLPPKVFIEKSIIEGINYKPDHEKLTTNFFFPAGSYVYKNHEVIVKACEELKSRGITDYSVMFTLNGNENTQISKLMKKKENLNLPIQFIGNLSKKDVYQEYLNSILVFPSFIETFGLPLLEMRILNGKIIASDTNFSREILENYNSAEYFQYDDFIGLADLMQKYISSSYENTSYEKVLDDYISNSDLVTHVIY